MEQFRLTKEQERIVSSELKKATLAYYGNKTGSVIGQISHMTDDIKHIVCRFKFIDNIKTEKIISIIKDEDNIAFSEDWEKEMMKFPKKTLIKKLRNSLI